MPSQGWSYAAIDESVVYGWTNGVTAHSVGEWFSTFGWVDVWEFSDGSPAYVCWRSEAGLEVPVEGTFSDLAAAMDAVESAFAAAAAA